MCANNAEYTAAVSRFNSETGSAQHSGGSAAFSVHDGRIMRSSSHGNERGRGQGDGGRPFSQSMSSTPHRFSWKKAPKSPKRSALKKASLSQSPLWTERGLDAAEASCAESDGGEVKDDDEARNSRQGNARRIAFSAETAVLAIDAEKVGSHLSVFCGAPAGGGTSISLEARGQR